jgi:hypothetical protein
MLIIFEGIPHDFAVSIPRYFDETPGKIRKDGINKPVAV